MSLEGPITALAYGGRSPAFLPFESVMVTELSVRTPARRPSSLLVSALVDPVRMFALAELDPRFASA